MRRGDTEGDVASNGSAPRFRPLCQGSGAGQRTGDLLDRDGTVIIERGHVGSFRRVQLVDGATEAIASTYLAAAAAFILERIAA